MFSFASGLSVRGVVVYKVGLPLMFIPGGSGLASFGASITGASFSDYH